MRNLGRPFAVVLASLTLLLAGGLAGCGEEQSRKLSPGIALETENGGRLGDLAFGEVPLGGDVTRTFVVRSAGPVALDVASITFVAEDGESAVAFSASPAGPFDLRSGDTLPITVHFRPLEVRHYQATAVVRSADPKRPEMRVSVGGDGVAGRLEVIACLPNTAEQQSRCAQTRVSPPDALSLGDVTEGAHAEALVTLQNGGGDELHVRTVAFADPAAAAAAGFALPDTASGGMRIPSRESGSFTVDFDPPSGTVGAASATLVIESDSVTAPHVELVIRADVVPNTAPQACLFVREIRHADGTTETFAPGDAIPQVEPTDVVTFDAAVREGCSGDAEDGTDVELEFTLTAPGAGAQLRGGDGPMSRTLEAEATGTYRVDLLVRDSLGLTATADAAGNPASVTLQVVPRRDIAVEIAWTDDPLVDVDLHFVRGSASLWTNDDTRWNNRSPDWGVAGDRFDDPALILDDLGTGALVETVVLNRPEAGQSYWVYARMNRDDRNRSAAPICSSDADCAGDLVCSMGSASSGRCLPAVDVELHVFFRSAEADLGTLPLPAQLKSPCDTWLAGRLVWPAGASGNPTFEPSNVFFADGQPQGNVCSVQ